MLTPADDNYDVEPDSRLESFFHIAMLMLGDPDQKFWIGNNAQKFYIEYRSWLKWSTGTAGPIPERYPESATALLQYMVWYDRERAHVDGREDSGP